MKYYHYISASKVEMLFPQVPHALREKISAEIGFNVGLVAGKVGSEVARSDDIVTRLKVVEQYLVDSRELGTVKALREWFTGEMTAQTMGLRSHGGPVFFVGKVAGVVVALGGSPQNMIGGQDLAPGLTPFSHLATLLRALEALVTNERSTSETVDLPVAEASTWRGQESASTTWEDLIRGLAEGGSTDFSRRRRPMPTERIHFVARLLAKGMSEGQRVILGTPLYVAAG